MFLAIARNFQSNIFDFCSNATTELLVRFQAKFHETNVMCHVKQQA